MHSSQSVLNAAKSECSSVESLADFCRSLCILPAAEKTRSTLADEAGAPAGGGGSKRKAEQQRAAAWARARETRAHGACEAHPSPAQSRSPQERT